MRFIPKPKQMLVLNGGQMRQERGDGRKQIREGLQLIQDLIYGTKAGDLHGETLVAIQVDASNGALDRAIPYTEKVIITLDVEEQQWGSDKIQVTMQVKTVRPWYKGDTRLLTDEEITQNHHATPVQYIDINLEVLDSPGTVYARHPSGRWEPVRQWCLWDPIKHRRCEIRKIMSEYNRTDEGGHPENIGTTSWSRERRMFMPKSLYHVWKPIDNPT